VRRLRRRTHNKNNFRIDTKSFWSDSRADWQAYPLQQVKNKVEFYINF
jgi:hypothetical protein